MTGSVLIAAPWSRRQVLAAATATLALSSIAAWAVPAASTAPIDWSGLRLLDDQGDGPAHWANLPVVVVFWATWCPYCKRHNAHVEKLYQYSQRQGFRVLGVTDETDREKIAHSVLVQQIHFPIALAASAFRTQFTSRRVLPLTCVVSAAGRLLQAIPGEMAFEDVMSLATLAVAKPKI